MSHSSPSRRSQILSSPDRGYMSNFLNDVRNNETNHLDALAAAQLEHEKVREAAIRVYELHELKEEHDRIVEQGKKEQERLKKEAQIAAEEKRLQELKAKSIPKPAPPPPPPEPAPEPSKPAPTADVAASNTSNEKPTTTAAPKQEEPALPKPKTNGFALPQAELKQPPQPDVSPADTTKINNAAAPGPTPTQIAPTKPQPQPATQSSLPPKPPAQASPAAQSTERYVQIHQALKKLRKDLQAQSKVPGSPLKGTMGTFRREIRVSIGQLTSGRGANTQPINKITNALRAALDGQIQSPPIAMSTFVAEPRQPVEGATHNDENMPALFVYLVNICAKGIISQFINECGANPKAADPIGVFSAHIFSNKDFQWRGQSLIDILIAKLRVVCPVLFGMYGSDKTEKGRQALGWRKDGPAWITEQSHNDRMAGLGAGFASLALRDFSKSSKTNPYPPTHYWKALAGIVNCPPGQTSNTQYVVLRAMLDGHEQRFLNFYGNAALAALRLALVEFPKKAPENSTAAGSLYALAEVLRAERGLALG